MSINKSKSTTKFLIYLGLFIVFSFVFVLTFVVPSIKEYKKVKAESSYLSTESKQLKHNTEEIQIKLKQSKKKNENIVSLFSQRFDKSKFITFSKKYFDNIVLTKIKNQSKSSALEIYKFSASVKAKNPRLLYNFINSLSSYDSIVKINFPINISSNDINLDMNFHISIYSMSQNKIKN